MKHKLNEARRSYKTRREWRDVIGRKPESAISGRHEYKLSFLCPVNVFPFQILKSSPSPRNVDI